MHRKKYIKNLILIAVLTSVLYVNMQCIWADGKAEAHEGINLPDVVIEKCDTEYGKVKIEFALKESTTEDNIRYEIAYRKVYDNSEWEYYITEDNVAKVEFLQENTKYEFRVRAASGEFYGEYSEPKYAVTNPSGEYEIPNVEIENVKSNYGKIRIFIEETEVQNLKYEIFYKETDKSAESGYTCVTSENREVLISGLKENVKYTLKVRAVADITTGKYSSLKRTVATPSGEYEIPSAKILTLKRNISKIRIFTEIPYLTDNIRLQIKYKKTSEPSSAYRNINVNPFSGGDNVLIDNLAAKTWYTVKVRFYIKESDGDVYFGKYSSLKRVCTM